MNTSLPTLLVHFHIYYSDQVPFFIEKMKNICDCNWDLTVTGNDISDDIKGQLRELNQNVRFLSSANVGYDVFPFLEVLRNTDLDKYDYILKLHTKSSANESFSIDSVRMSGYDWRNYLVNALLLSKDRFKEVLKEFSDHPETGMAASGELMMKMPLKNYLDEDYMADEEVRSLGYKVKTNRFCAGTIFISKAKLLKPLLKSHLTEADFSGSKMETHSGGSWAHAYERVFCWIVSAQGYRIKSFTSSHAVIRKRVMNFIKERVFSLNRFGSKGVKYLIIFGLRIKLDNGRKK